MVIGFLSNLSTSSEFFTGHAFHLFKLISALFLIIFLLFASLDTSGTFNVNRPASMTSTQDTYLASLGSKIFTLAKNWSQDPLFMVIGFLSILTTSSEFSIGHAFHLFKLIYALFLIIFLLFASLDTSGTFNVNTPATKTSTRDNYSALPGSKNFILAKNLSQDPIFVVTIFLSILSSSSEFSTGHAFHQFKLIFSMVTSFMLLHEERI